jgi:hypothetical protein
MLFIRLITFVLCICIVYIGSQIKTTSTTFCSDTIAIIESKVLNDTSWIEYIHEVYGSEDLYDTTDQSSSSKIDESSSSSSSSHMSINKYAIDFYYKNTNIQIQPINWNKDKLYANFYSKSDNYRAGYINYHKIVNNDTWIEISRFSSEFLWHGFQEGFTSPPWYRHSDPIKVPYGCWFFHAKGTGIYINVKKTLAFNESLYHDDDYESISHDYDHNHNHRDHNHHDQSNQANPVNRSVNKIVDKLGTLKVFPELDHKTMCFNNDKSKRCKDKCKI